MHPAVFLFALLSVVGIGAFTVVTVARLFAQRRHSPSPELAQRVDELERTVQGVQQELAETQERLDFTERLLSSAREERRLGS
jgi:hypothetical protein